MKLTTLLLLIISTLSKAQYNCYDDNYNKTLQYINQPTDTNITNYTTKRHELSNKVIGCQYPNILLEFTNADTNYLYSIESDIVILNFNYYYCDWCKDQLQELVDYKHKSKQTVKIISVFKENKSDIIDLIERFKNEIEIVANFPKNVDYYTLLSGEPTTFILDKNKHILQLLQFENQTIK
jgi:hypothetical protein